MKNIAVRTRLPKYATHPVCNVICETIPPHQDLNTEPIYKQPKFREYRMDRV